MNTHKTSIVFFSILATFLLFADSAFAEPPLLIYGSSGNERQGIIFLGCINCNKLDNEALDNQFGAFGSRFSDTSIYNKFSDWGSKFSDISACNSRATNPPVIVDGKGNFQGYLTLNKRVNGTVIDPRLLGACK
jgi:hypothetical protein